MNWACSYTARWIRPTVGSVKNEPRFIPELCERIDYHAIRGVRIGMTDARTQSGSLVSSRMFLQISPAMGPSGRIRVKSMSTYSPSGFDRPVALCQRYGIQGVGSKKLSRAKLTQRPDSRIWLSHGEQPQAMLVGRDHVERETFGGGMPWPGLSMCQLLVWSPP